MQLTHAQSTIAAVVSATVVSLWLLDRLIRWAETQSKRSYEDPDYVPASMSFNPLGDIVSPEHKRAREQVQLKEARGDEAEADGAPPEPGLPVRGAGPTAF